MIKRTLLCGFAALAGCSGSGQEPNALEQAAGVLSDTVGVSIGPEATSTRFAEISQTPRPILQVGLVNAGTAGNMLLEATDGPYERYLSPDASSIILNRGMLHSLYGFDEGLMGTEVTATLGMILRGQSGTADRTHTYLGGDDRTVFRTYRCVISNAGARSLTLPTGTISARLMTEDCRNADHSFQNLYWIDDSRGAIVQSRQWAGPNLGAVSTRRVRVSAQ